MNAAEKSTEKSTTVSKENITDTNKNAFSERIIRPVRAYKFSRRLIKGKALKTFPYILEKGTILFILKKNFPTIKT